MPTYIVDSLEPLVTLVKFLPEISGVEEAPKTPPPSYGPDRKYNCITSMTADLVDFQVIDFSEGTCCS